MQRNRDAGLTLYDRIGVAPILQPCYHGLYEGKPVGIDMPVQVVRTITYTEPGVKGDTSGKSLKPATLDTGIEVRVPLFINDGEKIVVDTRGGSFVERAK